MKKIMILFIVLGFAGAVRADNDEFYTIRTEEKHQDNMIKNIENIEEGSQSKTVIQDQLDIMKNEVVVSKQQMYKEISRFKYGF